MTRYIAVARPEVMAELGGRMAEDELAEMDARCNAEQILPEEYVGRLLRQAGRWHLVDLVGVAEAAAVPDQD